MTALKTDAPVVVIGAGTMGAGIAQVAATAGHPVYLHDVSPEAVDKGLAAVAKILGRSVEKGRLAAEERDAILGRIRKPATLRDTADAALFVEAIVENVEIKRKLFAEIEGFAAEDAILASNTSSISITEIGAGLQRPERLVGMHFFNPAPVMKLVEVVTGVATAPAVAETVFDTAAAWGKSPVYARSTPGFIANRIARPFYGEALRLVQEGTADVVTVDTLVRECGGFRMGPFELMDLIGTDVNLAVTKSVWEAFYFDQRFQPNVMQQELVAAGRHGRKTGQGWYDYREGAAAPSVEDAPQGPKPKRIVMSQNPDLAASLDGVPADPVGVLARMARAAGIEVAYEEGPPEGFDADFGDAPDLGDAGLDATLEPFDGAREYGPFTPTVIRLDGVTLRLTEGEPALRPGGWGETEDPEVLFDLCLDYETSPRIAITAAPGTPRNALLAAAGFFQALGKKVSIVGNTPGMVLFRIVAMLANEACDAVHFGVCTAEHADTAMLNGLNYPQGPLAWASAIGIHRVHGVLREISTFYGEPRYRLSPHMHRLEDEESDRIDRATLAAADG